MLAGCELEYSLPIFSNSGICRFFYVKFASPFSLVTSPESTEKKRKRKRGDSEEDAEKKKKKRESQRPNYFVSIPITNKQVQKMSFVTLGIIPELVCTYCTLFIASCRQFLDFRSNGWKWQDTWWGFGSDLDRCLGPGFFLQDSSSPWGRTDVTIFACVKLIESAITNSANTIRFPRVLHTL